MKKKIVISIAVLMGFATLGISQQTSHRTFIDKISSNLSYHPEWEVHPVTIDLRIFDQPFTYLDKGIQSYVFVSSDENYVLKFFNFDNMSPSFVNKHNQRQPILEEDFLSCKLAFEELAEETGLAFIHLNKTENLKKKVTLIKSGKRYVVNLDRMEFILQRKAELVHPTLERLMEIGELIKAQSVIDSILEVLITRYKKGIMDEDPLLSRNLGLIGNKAVIIDVGCLRRDEKIADPVVYKENLIKITAPLKEWLNENHHSVLAHYLEEQLKKI
jgi:hypothetical protein